MEGDPLFKYEDSRSDSRAKDFNLERARVEYIVELEIINLRSVVIYSESVSSDPSQTSSESRIYLSVHRPCTVFKIYPQKEHKP